jgi:hypothetical protein
MLAMGGLQKRRQQTEKESCPTVNKRRDRTSRPSTNGEKDLPDRQQTEK